MDLVSLAWIWRVPMATMRATLFSYAAFVCISLMLWSGCFGRRNTAGATPATRAPVVSTR
jgi:hypothetical protein